MSYRKEHPDFKDTGEVAQLIARGWSDQSWHNDTCPRFHSPDESLCVWVNYAEPDMRDAGPDAERFIVEFGGSYGQDDPLLVTNEWPAVLALLETFAAEVATLPQWTRNRINTESDATSFMREAHKAGKLWHLDDSPSNIEPAFSRAEVGLFYVRRDECARACNGNQHEYCIFLTNRPASWHSLDDDLRARFGAGLTREQRECIDDPERREECLGMLDDMQVRMGVPAAIVDAVRGELDGDWQ